MIDERHNSSHHVGPGDAYRPYGADGGQDIASAVAFLAGLDSGWINGQVLRANGGMI